MWLVGNKKLFSHANCAPDNNTNSKILFQLWDGVSAGLHGENETQGITDGTIPFYDKFYNINNNYYNYWACVGYEMRDGAFPA